MGSHLPVQPPAEDSSAPNHHPTQSDSTKEEERQRAQLQTTHFENQKRPFKNDNKSTKKKRETAIDPPQSSSKN